MGRQNYQQFNTIPVVFFVACCHGADSFIFYAANDRNNNYFQSTRFCKL